MKRATHLVSDAGGHQSFTFGGVEVRHAADAHIVNGRDGSRGGVWRDPRPRSGFGAPVRVPKPLNKTRFDANSTETIYDDLSRKVFDNKNHTLAAIGKLIPSINPAKRAIEYVPAVGQEHRVNPLWGIPGTPIYADARQNNGIRKRIFDPATGLTTALFYDPRGGIIYYDRNGNKTRGPAGHGSHSNFPFVNTSGGSNDFINKTSDFSAGAGDSLTMGATAGIRQLAGVDGIVDKSSPAYGAGEATEMAIEIGASGGSAYLKHLAERKIAEKLTAEGILRKTAVSRLRGRSMSQVRKNFTKEELAKGTPHHANPLLGHPVTVARGAKGKALFPKLGVPASINGSRANIRVLSHAEHMAAHRRMIQQEELARKVVNRHTVPVRLGVDIYRRESVKNR